MTDLGFGFDEDDLASPQTSAYLARLDQITPEALAHYRDLQDSFQEQLRDHYGAGFDSLQLAYHFGIEAADWAAKAIPEAVQGADDEAEFTRYYMVIRGLTARSLLSFSEIVWLLRGGYVSGALSRVRTLYELAVVAHILAEHGSPGKAHPELVERYIRHREAFTRTEADQLIATGVVDPTILLGRDTLQALDRQKQQLLDQYGKSFSTLWGWAAPLFKPGDPISMIRLSQLVDPKVSYFYGMTSEHVHGGSAGLHANVIQREHETVLATGPTNLGLSIPVDLATHFTFAVLEIAVPTRIKVEGESDEKGALLLAGVDRVMQAACDQFSEGEAIIEAAEREFQASRQHHVRAGGEDQG